MISEIEGATMRELVVFMDEEGDGGAILSMEDA